MVNSVTSDAEDRLLHEQQQMKLAEALSAVVGASTSAVEHVLVCISLGFGR